MHVKIESKFVRPNEHVRDGEHVVFLNEGEERQGQYGKKFNVLVRLPNGEEKLLSLNNSSKRNMIGHYGGDSAKWIGKEARVNIARQLVGTEMKPVIILTPPNIDVEGQVIIE